MSLPGPKRERKVLIVGAGFSGLVLARALVKRSIPVQIVERESRAGGLLGTHATAYGPVETAANGLLLTGSVKELFDDVGVSIQTTRRESRARYIAINGEPKRWPLDFIGTVRFLWGVLRYIMFRTAPQKFESVFSFGSRVLGRRATRDLVSPALLGIYGDASENLSASLLLSKKPRERARGTVSAQKGMGQLISGLEVFLRNRGVEIQFNTPMTRSEIETKLQTQPVVIATSLWDAEALTNSNEIREALANVEIRGLVSVTLFFSQAPKVRGFGVLFRQSNALEPKGKPEENSTSFDEIYGCLQNSSIFEGRSQEGFFSETWILGPRWVGLSEAAIIGGILKARSLTFAAIERPVHYEINRWDRALPRYGRNLEHALEVFAQHERDLLHFGNYRGEIGLSKILARAEDLAQEIATRLKEL